MKSTSEFFDYHVWSYRTILEHMQSLPSTVLHTEFENGFKSIADLLIHVYNVDGFWYSILYKEHEYTKLSKIESVIDYKEYLSKLHQSIRELLIQQTNFEKDIQFTSRNGNPMNNTINEILLTIINHGTYHRGNISVMLRQLGFKSASSDYAFFLNSKRNT
jgi:uncharacterized damage-inducible protein DinB